MPLRAFRCRNPLGRIVGYSATRREISDGPYSRLYMQVNWISELSPTFEDLIRCGAVANTIQMN